MRFNWLIAAAVVASVSTPALAAKKPPPLTPMELQAIQAKEFEASKEALFGSVMSVFQDLGYTVDSADIQTGFITAQSANKDKTNFGEALLGVASSGNTKATAFVEMMPNSRSRVRLNFINTKTMSSSYGQSSREDRPILDAKPYLAAWDKIDEALFVRGFLTRPAPAGTTATPVASSQSPAMPPGATPVSVKPASDPR